MSNETETQPRFDLKYVYKKLANLNVIRYKMVGNVLFCYVLLAVGSTWLDVSAKDVYSAATSRKLQELNDLIDTTVDPCDDFQKFVCSKVDTDFSTVTKKLDEELMDKTLNSSPFRGQRTTNFYGNAVKKFFYVLEECEWDGGKNLKGNVAMLQELMDKYVFDRTSSNFEFKGEFNSTLLAKAAAYFFTHYGVQFLPGLIQPIRRIKKPKAGQKEFITAIGEPTLLFDRKSYDPKNTTSESLIRNAFRKATDMAFWKNDYYVNITADRLYNFEVEISKLFEFPQTEMTSSLINEEFSGKQVKEMFPQFDWETYFYHLKRFGSSYSVKFDDIKMKFVNPNVTRDFLDIITKTQPDLLRRYMNVRAAHNVMLDYDETNKNRCKTLLYKLLPLVKQFIFINASLPTAQARQKIKSDITRLADSVITGVKKMMEKVSWMRNDKKTYAGFNAKINSMKKTIAFPDNLTNEDWLSEKHSSLEVNPSMRWYEVYAEGMKLVSKYYFTNNEYFGRTYDISAANAYLDVSANHMYIHLGILNDLIYNPDYVPAINYGSLGAVIGHEAIHAFDTMGVVFDHEGYMNPWMSNSSQEKFDSMAACVIDEYNNFNSTDAKGKAYHVDGKLTVRENLTDLGGIRASYNAFKSDPANMKPFPRISKLPNLTQDQLFFLSFGRFWCGPPVPDADKASLEDHSPNQFRIFGVLRNFEPFRKAFNCPANSKYAHKKHCKVFAPDL